MDTKTQIYPLAIEAEVIEALRQVYDPEIPVNIYELGLIYEIDVDTYGNVDIDMTLTSPACPVAGTLPGDVQRKVQQVEGVQGRRCTRCRSAAAGSPWPT